jgi:hypothetical protein
MSVFLGLGVLVAFAGCGTVVACGAADVPPPAGSAPPPDEPQATMASASTTDAKKTRIHMTYAHRGRADASTAY